MAQRHVGLTVALADALLEAAAVCLEQHHRSPTAFDVARRGRIAKALTATAQWSPPSPRTKDAWANRNNATECGACACVLAAVELTDGLVAVRRADTGSGADYYVAPAHRGDDLENWQRLEISGVSAGDLRTVERRLRVKQTQASAGKSDLPALAGVIGFKAGMILVADA